MSLIAQFYISSSDKGIDERPEKLSLNFSPWHYPVKYKFNFIWNIKKPLEETSKIEIYIFLVSNNIV